MSVVVGLALADAMRDRVVARLCGVPRGEALARDLARAAVGIELRLLREIEDGRVAPAVDAARVERLEPGEHAQQRRLAGAVRAEERDLLAAPDGEGRVLEERLAARRPS